MIFIKLIRINKKTKKIFRNCYFVSFMRLMRINVTKVTNLIINYNNQFFTLFHISIFVEELFCYIIHLI